MCCVLVNLKHSEENSEEFILNCLSLTEQSALRLQLSPSFCLSSSSLPPRLGLRPFLSLYILSCLPEGLNQTHSNIIMHPINTCFISEGDQVFTWTPHLSRRFCNVASPPAVRAGVAKLAKQRNLSVLNKALLLSCTAKCSLPPENSAEGDIAPLGFHSIRS